MRGDIVVTSVDILYQVSRVKKHEERIIRKKTMLMEWQTQTEAKLQEEQS